LPQRALLIMKNPPRSRAFHASHRRGFSLAETVIAVGIVAAALLPLVALLGTTTRSELTSSDRMSAALIAEAVFEELAASASDPALFIHSSEGTGGLNRMKVFSGGMAGGEAVIYLAGGVEGGVIEAVDEGIYESGYSTAGVVAPGELPGTLLRLELTSEDGGEAGTPGGGGLIRVRLSVEHPAGAGRSDRQKEVFETFLNLSRG